jgi:hypothetical protein
VARRVLVAVPDGLMGASNVAAAYTTWAGKVPPLSMVVLTYMALVSRDGDRQPWFGQGHAALAVHALGRVEPVTEADIRAVERAVAPLAKAGAIRADRRASVRRDGPSTVRYRLNLWPSDVPRNSTDDTAVDIDADHPSRPTESGAHVPRNPESRPTESVATSHGNRGTEEYEEYEEQEKEEGVDQIAAVTVPRARCDHGVPTRIRCPACARGIGAKERHLRAV